MNPMPPSTFKEVFKFYDEYVKLLYSEAQTDNHLPLEVLFEIHAALDHISRHYVYDESEAVASNGAFGHLKRSCLDIFKIRLNEATSQFDKLRKIDTSIIDNGKFDNELVRLNHNMRTAATEARRREGDPKMDDHDGAKAFELWEPVYEMAVKLEKEFYCNEHLDWAKKKQRKYRLTTLVLSIIGSLIAGGFIALISANQGYLNQLFVLIPWLRK